MNSREYDQQDVECGLMGKEIRQLEAENNRLRLKNAEILGNAELHDLGQEARVASLKQSLMAEIDRAGKAQQRLAALEAVIKEAAHIIERHAADCCNIEPCSVCVASSSWLNDATVQSVRESMS